MLLKLETKKVKSIHTQLHDIKFVLQYDLMILEMLRITSISGKLGRV